jgi:hypothetical protein
MNIQNLPPDLAVSLQQDNVTFWSERFRDHAMILYILIDPQRANDLKLRAMQELENWTSQLINPNSSLLIQLTSSLLIFKRDVQERAHNNIINLMIEPDDFKALVKHMIEELNFFIGIYDGQITPEKELEFWTRENSEHTELVAHLLPEGQSRMQNLQLANQLKIIADNISRNIIEPDILSIYDTSTNMAMELDQMLSQQSNLITTIVHIMLVHEIKEALRGERRIRELLGS